MRLRALLLFLALGLLAVICIREPRGAARHPLMVRTAITNGDVASSNQLFAPCPLSPQNIPHYREKIDDV